MNIKQSKRNVKGKIFIHRSRESMIKEMKVNKNFEWRSCEKKKVYPSLEDASSKAIELNHEPDLRNWQESYKCEFCDFYHIGRSLKNNLNRSFEKDIIEEDLICFYGLPPRVARFIAEENIKKPFKRLRVIKRKHKAAIRIAQWKATKEYKDRDIIAA